MGSFTAPGVHVEPGWFGNGLGNDISGGKLFKKVLTPLATFEKLRPHTEQTIRKMRTKTLLLTAAVTAVGIATSTAQVFSVNTVGYVRRDAPPGFSIIANPLKNGANKIADLFAGAPNGFVVYKYTGSSYLVNTYDAEFQLWDDPDQTLNPGEAAFVRNPTQASVTFTFVGEVPEGTLNTDLPKGFSLAASQVPQAGLLETDLKFPAEEGDTVYRYRNGGYLINFHEGPGIGWNEEPTVEVAEGFFVLKKNAAAVWTRTFTVN